MADGLAAAHRQGTVHRDVKPGNVLIAGDTAKISDFGIARTHGDEQLTRTGLVMGTPLYFSPELARGADPTPAADVWALGATLYAAVEGVPPIADRGNAIATLAAIAETRPPHPEHAGFLTDAIGRMLDPDRSPAGRCPTRPTPYVDCTSDTIRPGRWPRPVRSNPRRLRRPPHRWRPPRPPWRRRRPGVTAAPAGHFSWACCSCSC